MRTDLYIYIGKESRLHAVAEEAGCVQIYVAAAKPNGNMVCLCFESLEVADKFADQIWHLRMDRDADAM